MRTGNKSGYWIIEWADGFDPNMWDFLPRFPEVVLGHRVAITSFDSGPFEPTPEEFAKGWFKQEGVAISPVVDNPEDLPAVGFDEWYVFPEAVLHTPQRSFVNYLGFAPLNEHGEEPNAFWEQVERCQPLHVIGVGLSLFLSQRIRSSSKESGRPIRRSLTLPDPNQRHSK